MDCSYCERRIEGRIIFPRGYTHYFRWAFCSQFCREALSLQNEDLRQADLSPQRGTEEYEMAERQRANKNATTAGP